MCVLSARSGQAALFPALTTNQVSGSSAQLSVETRCVASAITPVGALTSRRARDWRRAGARGPSSVAVLLARVGGTAPRWGPRACYGVPPLNGPFFERPEPFEEVSPPGGQQVPVGS